MNGQSTTGKELHVRKRSDKREARGAPRTAGQPGGSSFSRRLRPSFGFLLRSSSEPNSSSSSLTNGYSIFGYPFNLEINMPVSSVAANGTPESVERGQAELNISLNKLAVEQQKLVEKSAEMSFKQSEITTRIDMMNSAKQQANKVQI